MLPIRIIHHLPFVDVTLRANGQSLRLEHVLLDTGSAGTVFRTDDLYRLGVLIQPDDPIRYMVGVGGYEAVIEKRIEAVEAGDLIATPFLVQLGALDYGIQLDGILGLDFLLQTGAIINLRQMVLEKRI